MAGMTRRGFVTTALGMGACVALAGCGSSDGGDTSADEASYTLVEDGKLTVAFSNGFPPLEFSESDGATPQGFDIDLINAVAEKMGLECNLLPSQKFDTLVPTVKAGGKADACISAVTINDKRKQEIDFSDPYLNSNLSILALATSDFAAVEDFDKPDVKIACSAGTTGAGWAQENLTQATVLPLDDYVSCFTGCEAGLYEGVVADLPVASYLCTNSYKDLKVCVDVPTGEQYGIGVSKDNPNLTKAINKALAALEEDGSMDDMKIKWFGTTEGL